MSAAATAIRSEPIRIYPSAIVLGALAVIFGMAAGYSWLGVSRDYGNYLSTWNALTSNADFSQTRFERGYMLASWIAKFELRMDFAQFYSVLAAAALMIKFRLLWKLTQAPVVAAIVYLMLLFPYYEYTQLRAAVGMALAYYSIDKLVRHQFGPFLCLSALSALFHTSAVVISLAAIAATLLRKQSPLAVAWIFAAVGLGIWAAIKGVLIFMQLLNPLVERYVDPSLGIAVPNLLSGEVLLLAILIPVSAVFIRPWRSWPDKLFFYMSFWSQISLVALYSTSAIAFRIRNLFIMSYLLFAFRFDARFQSRFPGFVLIVTALWMAYKSVSEGWLLN